MNRKLHLNVPLVAGAVVIRFWMKLGQRVTSFLGESGRQKIHMVPRQTYENIPIENMRLFIR